MMQGTAAFIDFKADCGRCEVAITTQESKKRSHRELNADTVQPTMEMEESTGRKLLKECHPSPSSLKGLLPETWATEIMDSRRSVRSRKNCNAGCG
ncbi:unnamed protein product [Victoria cruziana]